MTKATTTTKKQLNRALGRSYPSTRFAAIDAAERIGAEYMGGSLVRTDECICEIVCNKARSLYWVVEADCAIAM